MVDQPGVSERVFPSVATTTVRIGPSFTDETGASGLGMARLELLEHESGVRDRLDGAGWRGADLIEPDACPPSRQRTIGPPLIA